MPRTRLGKWLAQGAAQTTASPQQATLSRPKSTVPSLRKHKSKKAAPRGRAVALARGLRSKCNKHRKCSQHSQHRKRPELSLQPLLDLLLRSLL